MRDLRKNTVTKSNYLIEAGYSLTLNEMRLILAAISSIDSRGKPMPEEVQIYAKPFGETYGLSENKSYEALQEAVERLYERDIRTFDGVHATRFRWVDKITYHTQEGYVSLSFTKWLKPYITKLHKCFTSYNMQYISKLKSKFSIRLFELLAQYKSTGFYIVDIDKFREMLELTDKYQRFANLKARVLEPAVNELREKSGIEVDYEVIKRGRTPKRLKFTFVLNEQIALF